MEKNISQIVDRLKNTFGFKSDTEVAAALKMTKTALYNHKSRETIPFDALFTFCEETKTSLDWLFTGEGTTMVAAPMLHSEDFIYIPQVSGEISAGGGLIPDNTIELRIAFRKDWIARKGDPQHMSLIRVSGDSMDPTLLSGDLVLIDHSRNYIDPQGGIYAIAMDHTIMIKRLQVLYPAPKVRIISDNNRYDTIETDPAEIKINGKVIWFGREVER